MLTVLLIGYVGCVLAAFKIIKVKVNAVSIAAAVVGGIFLLGTVAIAWKQAAPITKQMFLRRKVVQINPDVREFVSKVHVKPDQRVKKGDPLFDIKPDRFQAGVNQASAQLTAAQATVSQLKAGVAVAEAAVKQSKADTATAKAELDTGLSLQKDSPGAIAKLQVKELEQGFRAAQADDDVKEATLKQVKFSQAAAEHSVGVAQASLNTAKFNLDRCTFVSPVDGQVVNWQIREGTPVARWRFTSVGTIMDFADTAIIGIFPQNQLNNVKEGDVVEIAFKSRPGEIASGKVDAVVKYTGEGQLMPGSKLPSAASIGSKGHLAVRIVLDSQELAGKLPLGAAGSIAIYTDFGQPLHLISTITIRINAWMNYLPF
jgi:multidrug resistance efflux pump